MLLRIFKGTGPGVIFLITVTCLAIWINAYMHPAELSASQFNSGAMPLYELLTRVAGTAIHLPVLISFLLVVIISFLLVNFNTTSFFINERTYLPALLYILAGGFFPEYQSLNPALPASLFLMLAIIRIMDGYRKQGVANNFFDAGLLISTGSLFYANLIWFGVLIIIGIALIRTVDLSSIIISLLGLLIPYLIIFGIYYVTGKDLRAFLTLIKVNLFLRTEVYFFSRLTIVSLILGSIIVIVSLAYLFTLLNSKKIKSRKTFSLLIWTFLISVALYFIMPSVSFESVWITAIPVSYFLTHYLIFNKNKWVPEIFLSVLLLIVLAIQIAYIR